MLWAINGGKLRRITDIPEERKLRFNAWMRNLAPADYQRIVDELNRRFDGSEIETSSFIPGNNWTGTVWEPLFHACGEDVEQSGLFFGLIVWKAVIDHQADWSFGEYFEDILGKTYFRINV